jgi:hypothetical protein
MYKKIPSIINRLVYISHRVAGMSSVTDSKNIQNILGKNSHICLFYFKNIAMSLANLREDFSKPSRRLLKIIAMVY